MKITVAGTGYVGLSIAVLLAQHHTVTALDIVPEKVACINEKKSPIVDAEMEDYLANKPLQLHATTDQKAAYTGADIIVISTPTNYDPKLNYFDTSSVEAALGMALQYAPDATIVIKSTVPVGYTRSLQERAGHRNILFSPEFCAKGMHCMTTCIRAALLSAVMTATLKCCAGPGNSPACWPKARWTRTCRPFSPA